VTGRLPVRATLRWAALAGLAALAVFAAAALLVQLGSEEASVRSQALGEERRYRVFNPGGSGPIVYALDGQAARNGLIPATLFSLSAMIRGAETPTVVVVYSGRHRDLDFRPRRVVPTHWRPKLRGRAPAFDHFLFTELIPQVEHSPRGDRKRYLMGHSLAGLYALDVAARSPRDFHGVFAFSPTFSHDLSIKVRLPAACRGQMRTYANWGLESARDTEVFNAVTTAWRQDEACTGQKLKIRHHYGVIHQLIMTTGQIEAAARYLH
jgi:predicted alpha/beta superfamily hydrolase